MSEPLTAIERRIFQSRGILYEGDVFSILLHSPFVVRGFEFAPADGAIDCTRRYKLNEGHAGRHWDLLSRADDPDPDAEQSVLALFEVKSSVANKAGAQEYITTAHQKRCVAFFIGICAADPTFVDVIPNYFQDEAALVQHEDSQFDESGRRKGDRELAVNTTRVSKLPASAYGGLDQCTSPYRMPISLLPTAIASIRRCINDSSKMYTNPWTGVSFPDWKPITTTSGSHLRPAHGTHHFTAYEIVMDILNHSISLQHAEVRLRWVGMAPRLADFVINGRFIQHKFDPTRRAHNARLEKVPIARNEEKRKVPGYYFSTFDRFDYLWYQFNIAQEGGSAADEVFFLLPERELPDSFYSTLESMVSFELESFRKYRIMKDRRGDYLKEVERILRETENPRSDWERPLRKLPDYGEDMAEVEALERNKPDSSKQKQKAGGNQQGRREYKETLTRSQRRFFYSLMKQCAIRMSGLILVLATNAPAGDFGYCRFRWTEEQRDAFVKFKIIPRAAHNLPANTMVVPICYYTQYAECGYHGPMVRARQFRRLDCTSKLRLVLWDLGGYDTIEESGLPIVIPTDDILVTDPQREVFRKTLAGRKANTPLLSALLKTGRHLTEYAVDFSGPLSFSKSQWGCMWEFLDRATKDETFQHPQQHHRQSTDYQWTLRSIHQGLVKEHGYGVAEEDLYEEDD